MSHVYVYLFGKCLPTYVPSRKGNHVTEADLKCEKCNKKFTKRGGLFR